MLHLVAKRNLVRYSRDPRTEAWVPTSKGLLKGIPHE